MTKKLIWRLADRPTPSEVQELVKSEIISKEEAREILFSQEDEKERDKKSLESEIKFLRELVERLSKNNQTTIVEQIRYIEKPYVRWDWYRPYQVWCSANGTIYQAQAGLASAQYAMGNQANALGTASAFNTIKTF